MIFAGKNIIVVGGSSGIGLSVITALTGEGASVYNLSRTANDHWPQGVNHREWDVTNENNVPVDFMPDIFHGLLYTVGSINLKPFNRLTGDDFINDFRINVTGAVKAIQMALPALKNSSAASVVLMSSVAANFGMGFHSSVAAAKGAVNGLTLALAANLHQARSGLMRLRLP